MADLRDPKFQSAFKAAGNGLVATTSFVNKYMQKSLPPQAGQPQSAGGSPGGSDVAPPRASKPTGLNPGTVGIGGSGTFANPPKAAPAPPVGNRVRGIGLAVAQFDYASQEATDLPFNEGDKITILSKESDDWWK